MKKIALIILMLLVSWSLTAQNVGIDQANPSNKLDVNGGLSVGSNYSGTFAAPSNGAIIEGQVGIGTATPTADLDVNGTLRVGSLMGTGTSMVVSDANGNLSILAIQQSIWTLSGINTFYSGGRVGIGNNNPAADLDIRTSATAINGDSVDISGLSLVLSKASNSFTQNAIGIGLGSSADFTVNQSSIGAAIIHQRTGPSSIGKLHFATKGNLGTATDIPIRMTIDDQGDVGIGTLDPAAKLEVSNGTIGLEVNPGFLDGVANNDWVTLEMAGLKNLRVSDNFSVSENMGIGASTMAADARLYVNGNIRVADNGDLFGIDQIVGFDDLRFYGDSIGFADFAIAAAGYAGFGTSFSNVTLNVRNIASNTTGQVFNVEKNDGTDIFQIQADQDVFVIGDFSVVSGTKNFMLDHPLDPENKNLTHNAVESPDHVTYYHGTVQLDANGTAIVALPDYFEALNSGFHYQLTCIGGFAQVYIAEEIANNQFSIAGGTSGLKVSWQVTATRNDPWAKDHPYEAETEKETKNKGKYWYPEGYGKPKSMQIGYNKEGSSEN